MTGGMLSRPEMTIVAGTQTTVSGNGYVAGIERRRRSILATLTRRVVTVILGVILALTSVGALFAERASAQVSGGAYVHPVACVPVDGSYGVLRAQWLPWYTTNVAVRPWFQVNGQWVPLDAVTDYGSNGWPWIRHPGFQDWKRAHLRTNGYWYYDEGSRPSGRDYARSDMELGFQPNGSPFYPRGYWYYLEFWYLNPWTGKMNQVQTQTCFMK